MDSEKIKLAEQLYSRYQEIIDFIYKVGNDQLEENIDENWNGQDFYYNIGENNHRNWSDYIKYSYIAAGGGKKYTEPLKRLKVGNRIFAYYKSKGYLGVGTVIDEAIPAKDFIEILKKNGIDYKKFTEPNLDHDIDNLEKCEWMVRVKWQKIKENRDDAIFLKESLLIRILYVS